MNIDPALRAGGASGLTPAQEEALYEIVAQAVGNTLRHAAAETIRVSLWREGVGLRLRVVDDGRGAKPRPSAALIEEGHIGLALLREHARALGGRLEGPPRSQSDQPARPRAGGQTGGHDRAGAGDGHRGVGAGRPARGGGDGRRAVRMRQWGIKKRKRGQPQ